MAKASEEISKYNANSGGKTDANLANDSNHLGGIPADQYATQKYVQNYHDTKEAKQKEYIDQQDQSTLQEAKSYAEQIVANQDFSSFAKVTDVQAVDTKLSNTISQEATTQKNYTDNKVQAVVNDVNSNFNDVNNAINTLNANQSSLFQSVSNGKSKIAGAITDKGVATSASDSFDTMAGNIRNITTGGSGSIDPNFVNTSDATATASDIMNGKTAYVQGQKIYGTLIAQAEEGMPTYGTDTSNATATEADIAYGKTAYARGQYLVGTMKNLDVEEIYGVEVDSLNYEIQTEGSKDVVTGDAITTECIAYSKDLNYCVRSTYLNNDNSVKYIESYVIDSGGMCVLSSTNSNGETEYKKYRYSYEELGISNNETVCDIAISNGGVDGDPKKAHLYILTHILGEDSKYYHNVYIFTYHIRENGIIGKEYNNEHIVNLKSELPRASSYLWGAKILPCNLNLNKFFIVLSPPYLNGSCFYLYSGTIYNENIITSERSISGIGSAGGSCFALVISPDDKYIYNSFGTHYKSLFIAIDVEDNYNISESRLDVFSVEGSTYDMQRQAFLSRNDNRFNAPNKNMEIHTSPIRSVDLCFI